MIPRTDILLATIFLLIGQRSVGQTRNAKFNADTSITISKIVFDSLAGKPDKDINNLKISDTLTIKTPMSDKLCTLKFTSTGVLEKLGLRSQCKNINGANVMVSKEAWVNIGRWSISENHVLLSFNKKIIDLKIISKSSDVIVFVVKNVQTM